jgi:hypothetical protein
MGGACLLWLGGDGKLFRRGWSTRVLIAALVSGGGCGAPCFLRMLGEDFEAVGDFGGFAEHGGYGAVFVLA